MKALCISLLLAVLLIPLAATSPSVLAAPDAKTETVILTTNVVNNTVELTATTLKHGSAYTASWDGATAGGTILNSDGYYVSTAVFTPSGPGIYTITYNITMTAGNGRATWTGTSSIEIAVGPDGTSFSWGVSH